MSIKHSNSNVPSCDCGKKGGYRREIPIATFHSTSRMVHRLADETLKAILDAALVVTDEDFVSVAFISPFASRQWSQFSFTVSGGVPVRLCPHAVEAKKRSMALQVDAVNRG